MEFEDAFRIRATASSAAERFYVLKDGELFAVFDQFGDIQSAGSGSQGLYYGGTRHLSRLALLIEKTPPLLLSSTVRLDNAAMAVDLTNPDLESAAGAGPVSDTLHIRRTKLLYGEDYWEEVTLQNHGQSACTVTVSLLFDCDYKDVFEVRGVQRKSRGAPQWPSVEGETVTHSYIGLDGALRRTMVRFFTTPDVLASHRADFHLRIEPKATRSLAFTAHCESAGGPPRAPSIARSFEDAAHGASAALEAHRARAAEVTSTNEFFNRWVARSFTDLYMLTTETPEGPYPYGGVPWFCTPFGRDGIITALECLWWNPNLARGVLSYLAARQSTGTNPERDAEPGKILHERRFGEMAALGEIPFGEYYGSVDSTPLFVHLAGAYLERCGDLEFAENLWPAVERAVAWIRNYGDMDGDGYVEYRRTSETGLLHQGWKDSGDSVFHADGSDAEPPIALCEVQGYTYAAFRSAAFLAEALGKGDLSSELTRASEELKNRFNRDFWCDDLGTYALALDARKRPCAVRTSNAGQCLWTGIVSKERIEPLIRSLMDERSFSGWGFRTLAKGEPRYNPLAYHNGSVWPHDTALIGYGMSRHGHTNEAAKVLEALFEAAAHFRLQRLPELFCGFARSASTGPVRYPVACLPQAWAAGSVYLLLQAVLGLRIDARSDVVVLERPTLPPSIRRVHVRGLVARKGTVDITFTRYSGDVAVELENRENGVQVVVVK